MRAGTSGANDSLGPFIEINCGAIPENLLESELFGYESGAFTGASKKGKIGTIGLARRGTLCLDEIGVKRDERGRDVAKREGKWVLGPLKAEFYDLNLRMSIMVGRKFISRRSTPQTMSSRSRS